ncbi:soluble quino protein glucose/sorbosone dehydrogenase [Gorgonomyces haynaldii]|nr:soluble quino protein glucose/sorbosone dehydrogenase [Gorgonomyces haynaldii]
MLQILLTGLVLSQSDDSYTSVVTKTGLVTTLRLSKISGARTLQFDASGDLLILARGLNKIVSGWFSGDTMQTQTIVDAKGLNLTHGMALNQGYLYASSDVHVYRWPYTPGSRSLISTSPQLVVYNISARGNGGAPLGHSTRTLVFSPDNTLYVSVGSMENIDQDTYRSRVRRVRLADPIPQGGYDFDKMEIWADGLRNGVALAFDKQGRLWETDNGPDNLKRDDLMPNIFQENPAEEINLLDGPAGTAYGYPYCWSAYNVTGYPRGTQFAWPQDGSLQNVQTDVWCRNTTNNRPPLGYIPAHSSPIGSLFYPSDTCNQDNALGCDFADSMLVTLHGSWNTDTPKGFRVVSVPMSGGVPSGDLVELIAATNYQTRCFGNVALNDCFRPAGIAVDARGTLWVSSDSTGDIVQITRGKPKSSPASKATWSSLLWLLFLML